MTTPRTRARAVGLLCLAGLAVAATACNPGRPPAATVDGVDISAEHVDAMVDALVEVSEEARTGARGQGSDGTYKSAWAADILQVLIERVTVSRLARSMGIEGTDQDRSTAESELADQIDGPVGEGVGQKALDAMDDETREWLLGLAADGVALRRDLVGVSLPQTYHDHPEQFLSHCYRAVLLAPDDLRPFAERLRDGEDFGDLTRELSADAQLADTGGDVGCPSDLAFEAQVSPDIWSAVQQVPDGGLAGPVPLPDSDQVYVLEVGPPQLAPYEEVEQLAADSPSLASRLVLALLDDALADVRISIDPGFGRWDPEGLVVRPPTGPSGPTTLPEIVPGEAAPPAPQETTPPG